jgi:hypothetical protein
VEFSFLDFATGFLGFTGNHPHFWRKGYGTFGFARGVLLRVDNCVERLRWHYRMERIVRSESGNGC